MTVDEFRSIWKIRGKVTMYRNLPDDGPAETCPVPKITSPEYDAMHYLLPERMSEAHKAFIERECAKRFKRDIKLANRGSLEGNVTVYARNKVPSGPLDAAKPPPVAPTIWPTTAVERWEKKYCSSCYWTQLHVNGECQFCKRAK